MAAIASVIKYEGDNSTFIWKHPCEDFNTSSQLIVHESQEAILFLNGQALDLFGPGRHTLETENIPILRHLINIPTGGESAFHCEVYFINKTEQMAIRWGTDSKVQYVEPKNFQFATHTSGQLVPNFYNLIPAAHTAAHQAGNLKKVACFFSARNEVVKRHPIR